MRYDSENCVSFIDQYFMLPIFVEHCAIIYINHMILVVVIFVCKM